QNGMMLCLGKWRAWAPRHRERHQKDGHTRWRVTHALLNRALFRVPCRELISRAHRLCFGCERKLARKWIIFALVQQANLLAVEPFLFDLKISAQEKLSGKLLHSEAYGFRCDLESLVANAPRSALVTPGRIKFRKRR